MIDADNDGIADTASALVRRRLTEVGPRISDDLLTSYQIRAGVKGLVGDSDWQYDAYLIDGNVTRSNTQFGNVNRDRFQQALLLDLAADPTGGTCQDTAANGSTSGCAPINIFGEGNISDAGAAFLRTAVAAVSEFDQTIAGVDFNGKLPASEFLADDIGVAVGYEFIENKFDFRPSQDLAAGTIAGFNGSPATSGSYNEQSIYAEALLPILADQEFAKSLEVELAFRSTNYSTVGSVSTYKIASSWAPTDNLRIRGGFNTAIRAPNIGELFAPQGENFPSGTDPCSNGGIPTGQTAVPAAVAAICSATGVPANAIGSLAIDPAAGQVRVLSGGNPNLTEEEVDTFTVGAVYQPLDNLSISLDYFDIEIIDSIADFGGTANNVLSTCYTGAAGGIGSAFCNAITRRADGTINFIALSSQNVASETRKGFDLIGSYQQDLWNGNLDIQYVGTYTTEANFTAFAGDNTTDCAGAFGQNICGTPLPEYKHRMTFGWNNEDWTTQLSWEYIGSTDDDNPATTFFVEELDVVHYFDAAATYLFNENYSVTFGIENLLDKEIQIIGDNQSQANTYPELYDVFGRTFYVSASLSF